MIEIIGGNMNGTSICETCGKEYKWRRRNCDKPPRFCSFPCKSYIGLKTRTKNSDLNEEQNLARIKKFYEKYVVKNEGCWDWKGIIEKTGYAVLGLRPPIKAHRASWMIHKGPIPKGLIVCHNCPGGDLPRCTNPDHLWLGTYKENTQDKIKKGRSNTPRGIQLKISKLNESQVKQIRFMLKENKSCSEISRFFGVQRKIISRIKNGETWKHIGE